MIELSTNIVNITNGIVIVLSLLFMIHGYRKGVLYALVSLVGSLFSFFVAFVASTVFYVKVPFLKADATDMITQQIQQLIYPLINRIAWFVILFLALRIVVAIMNKVFQSMHQIPIYHFFSAITGALVGFVESVIWIFLICIVLQSPIFSNGNDIVEKSYLSTIKNVTLQMTSSFVDPIKKDLSFNEFYDKLENFTDRNLDNLLNWLKDNGYQGGHSHAD